MSALETLLRSDLAGFGGYASAAGRGFVPRIRLDANESPWANAADAGAQLRCYPEPQPQALIEALARVYQVAMPRVLACRGSDEGIDLLLRACCVPGAGAVVVAPPAHMTARSAYTHSIRVLLAIATRSSGRTPSARRPAAMVLTVSSTCAQVTESQPTPVGNRNASASGIAATRS